MSSEQHPTPLFLISRFSFLLLTLLFVLVVGPTVEGTRFSALMWTFGMTTVFISGTIANRDRKWVYRSAIAIAALAIPMSWATLLTGYKVLDFQQDLVVILFCGMTATMILLKVVRVEMVTSQAILGAICVYLLIGLTWATIYQAIELTDPESFAFAVKRTLEYGQQEQTSFSQFTYFSFVTMSTLGYGDISPRTPIAETACWVESIVGQLYIAILVARMVSEMPRLRSQPD